MDKEDILSKNGIEAGRVYQKTFEDSKVILKLEILEVTERLIFFRKIGPDLTELYQFLLIEDFIKYYSTWNPI